MNLSGRQTKKCLLKIRKRSSSREIRPCSETFSAFSCAPIPGMEIDMPASILEIKFMDSVFMTSSMVTFTKDLGTKGISKVMRCIPFRRLATVNGMEATSTPVFPLLQMQFFVQFSRLPEKQLKRRSTFIDEQVNKAEVSKNIDLVYGGGSIGLMGLVSQAVHDGGRHVIGMIPKMLMR